jgi:V8-like Glu-specific endopeptidase
MSWNKTLNNLITLMASLYSTSEQALFFLKRVGLDPINLNLVGSPKDVWLRIIDEANKRDLIPATLRIAKADFPNVDFSVFVSGQGRVPESLDIKAWHSAGDRMKFEKVTGQQPTFLPISFLEVGLQRSRSIARVESPAGLGTGFLSHGNLFITNHHVIRDVGDAANTIIWFNYQTNVRGADNAVSEFTLDPGEFFATSAIEDGDDWTVVRVKGNPNSQWGALELEDADVAVNDFVNIIQHPGGLPKQIAIYHNVVVYADDRRIQYLTDTMPGSSGSPVFDSRWRVVALHHSGGWLAEPATNNVFFRNEGISIRALKQGLAVVGDRRK